MSTSLPRKTLTVGVMAGFMVCTAMVNAQSERSRQTEFVVPTLHVETGLVDGGRVEGGRIAVTDQNQGSCPASRCVTQPGQCTRSQSPDEETFGSTVRCGAALIPTEDPKVFITATTRNGYARCFNLAAEGIQCGDFTIASVTFGVQTVYVTPPRESIQVDIVIYADSDGCPPPAGGSSGPLDATITELARETVFVTVDDVGTFITVPIVATLEAPLGGDLIVEIEQVDCGLDIPNFVDLFAFRPAGNGPLNPVRDPEALEGLTGAGFDAGSEGPTPDQCGKSYLRAALCGFPGWLDEDAIAGGLFIGITQFIMVVEGKLGGPCCPATVCSNICNCSLTQTATENIVEIVACDFGGTTPQGWARCFDFAAEEVPTNPLGYTIQSVTFGVLIASEDGIEVDVVVYTDNDGCPADTQTPGDGTVTEIARESILVNTTDVGTLITVPLSGKPKVPDDGSIIVEIEQLVDGSFLGGGFAFRPAGNKNAECDTSYLRAAFGCGIPDWTRFDGLPIPGVPTQVVIRVDIASNKIEGHLDIKPGSCPNPLNRSSNGKLPVALMFKDNNASDVDLSTLTISRKDSLDAGGGEFVPAFSGRTGPKRNLADVATPFQGEKCDCHTLGSDGNLDVQMKFDIAALRSALNLDAEPKRSLLNLCVTGRFNDGQAFIACDCVRIQGRGAPR